MNPKPKHDDPDQSCRFIELAEEYEAKGADDALARAVKKLASQPREKAAPKKERRSRK